MKEGQKKELYGGEMYRQEKVEEGEIQGGDKDTERGELGRRNMEERGIC